MTRWEQPIRYVFGLTLAAGALFSCADTRVERSSPVEVVSPDSVRAWMRGDALLVIFDIRTPDAYEARHLSGATLTGRQTVSQLRDVLPPDRDAAILVYNETGVLAEGEHDLATEAAEEFGFPHVYWLEGGIEGWVRAGYNVSGIGGPQ